MKQVREQSVTMQLLATAGGGTHARHLQKPPQNGKDRRQMWPIRNVPWNAVEFKERELRGLRKTLTNREIPITKV